MLRSPILAYLVVPAVFIGASIAHALGDDGGADQLGHRISTLLRSVRDTTVSYGVVVVDLAAGSVVHSENARVPLIPASNQKLLVMAAGIELLGPEFEFRTVVGIRGQDLVIVGDGDPAIGDPRLCKRVGSTVTSVFDRWADELERGGHAFIPGDLIIDESVFDGQVIHPSWATNELQKWYAAPVGALNLNDNCIDVTVWPAERAGAAPHWSVTPPSPVVEIINRAVSAGSGVPVISRPSQTFTFVLGGRCGSKATLEPVAVPDPGLFFAHACRAALHRAGVTIGGRIRRERVRTSDGSIPADLEVVAIYRTPIQDVLERIGKNSQNLFAECLVKRLGYEHARRAGRARPYGCWANGGAAITDFLDRSGIDVAGLQIADASGLSRRNRATAAQLVGILTHMHESPNRDLFVDNLAVAGKDGSLRRRMRDLGGRVIGKTGTLRGVTSLSGYVQSTDGRWYAFSIIFNDFKGPSKPYKRVQDELCRLIASAPGQASR